MRGSSRMAMVGLMSLLGACAAGQTAYRPTEQLAGEREGAPVARYSVPPESPRGDVTVSSRGVVFVAAREGDERQPMVHVRLVVSNDSGDGPWSVDVREQKLAVRGRQPIPPAIVAAAGSQVPVPAVPPGQQLAADLYYRLPPGVGSNDELPAFDVLWKVRTPDRLVAERTPFERILVEPRQSYAWDTGVGLGWSGLWWYDPFYYPYYRYSFYGHPFYAPPPRIYVAPSRRGNLERHGMVGPAPTAPSPPRVPAEPHISAPAAPGPAGGPSPAVAPPPVPATPNISAPRR